MFAKLYLYFFWSSTCFQFSEFRQYPENLAVKVDGNATIPCRDESITSVRNVRWIYYAVGSNAHINIFKDSMIWHEVMRFSVNDTDPGQYDLEIKQAQNHDAGTYVCCLNNEEFEAQLIILASDPVCQIRSEDRVYNESSCFVFEQESIQFECTITCWGNWDPTMQWHLLHANVDFVAETTNLNHNLKSILNLTTGQNLKFENYSQLSVSCYVHFAIDNHSFPATNIPDYNHIWTSPLIHLVAGSNPLVECSEQRVENRTGNITTIATTNGSEHDYLVAIFMISAATVSITFITAVAIILIRKYKCNGDHTEQDSYDEINELGIRPPRRPAAPPESIIQNTHVRSGRGVESQQGQPEIEPQAFYMNTESAAVPGTTRKVREGRNFHIGEGLFSDQTRSNPETLSDDYMCLGSVAEAELPTVYSRLDSSKKGKKPRRQKRKKSSIPVTSLN